MTLLKFFVIDRVKSVTYQKSVKSFLHTAFTSVCHKMMMKDYVILTSNLIKLFRRKTTTPLFQATAVKSDCFERIYTSV